MLKNRRSEEDCRRPIPLWSIHIDEELHHFKAQWSLHVLSAVILSVFAIFLQYVFVCILGNTPIIFLKNLVFLIFIGHLSIFCETGFRVLCIR